MLITLGVFFVAVSFFLLVIYPILTSSPFPKRGMYVLDLKDSIYSTIIRDQEQNLISFDNKPYYLKRFNECVYGVKILNEHEKFVYDGPFVCYGEFGDTIRTGHMKDGVEEGISRNYYRAKNLKSKVKFINERLSFTMSCLESENIEVYTAKLSSGEIIYQSQFDSLGNLIASNGRPYFGMQTGHYDFSSEIMSDLVIYVFQETGVKREITIPLLNGMEPSGTLKEYAFTQVDEHIFVFKGYFNDTIQTKLPFILRTMGEHGMEPVLDTISFRLTPF